MTNNFKEDSKRLNKENLTLFKIVVMDNTRFESDHWLLLTNEHDRFIKKKIRINPYRPRIYRYDYWR